MVHVEEALKAQNLTLEDVRFDKAPHPADTFRLDVVNRFLSDPLALPGFADSLGDSLLAQADEPSALVAGLSALLDGPVSAARAAEIDSILKGGRMIDSYDFNEPDYDFPEGLERPLRILLTGIFLAQKAWVEGYRGISEDTAGIRMKLLTYSPEIWLDEDDSLGDTLAGLLMREINSPRGLAMPLDTTDSITTKELVELARLTKPEKFYEAGYILLRAVEFALPLLRAYRGDFEGKVWGGVILGRGNDEYSQPFGGPGGPPYVLIDLGGDDVYRTRVGTGFEARPSIVIDLCGDDLYVSGRSFDLGAGFLGAGLLVDAEGDDYYKSGFYSQGSALFGFGGLIDLAGDDVYEMGFFGQGAGNFGIGLLVDRAGNDSYRSTGYAQAFAGTGGAGLLLDGAGDDRYYCGGKYPHTPLYADRYRSFGQGFAIGFRDYASGGVAVLLDGSGSDFYEGGVFSQASAYWYSLSLLLERGGADVYNSVQYAQGAGIHLAVSGLFDDAGDDVYTSFHGPGQGEGHDYSVGILFDRAGSDSYSISGGLGVGLTNSFGLFCDFGGDDLYSTSELGLSLGGANMAREKGGIGVFLDLGGKDVYPRGAYPKNGGFWRKGTWGVGMDVEGGE